MPVDPKRRGGASGGAAGRAISYGLVFVKYWRTIAILIAFALTAGLTYFVYAKSVYYSKSIVRFDILDLPVNSESAGTETPVYRLQRSLLIELRSRHLIERTARRMGLVSSLGSFYTIQSQYVQSVTVQILDSFNIKIEVMAYDPEIARTWTQYMVEEYLTYQSELRMRHLEMAEKTYQEEFAAVKEMRASNLAAKSDFEKRTNYMETAIERQLLTEGVRDLYLARHQLKAAERAAADLQEKNFAAIEKLARLDMYEEEKRLDDVPNILRAPDTKAPVRLAPSTPDSKVVVLPREQSASVWKKLSAERRNLLENRTELVQKGFGPDHQDIKRIDGEIASLDRRIESTMVSAVEEFQTEFRQLASKEKQLTGQLSKLREKSAEQDALLLEYEYHKYGDSMFENAAVKLKEKMAALEFGANKERVVLKYAGVEQMRDDPVSPNKMKLVYTSLALGLILGIGVPLALEHFNDTAAKIEEIEQALELPGLGIVPVTASNELENIVRSPDVDAEIPNSLLENFRVIRSGISLNGDLDSQVIMVTSARPSEGKTVNSCNLGWAFSSLSEPTLLIDGDLRRGRVHDVLQISNEVGLSSVVTGKAGLDEAIQKTQVPNLYALPRGPIIPGSTEKLCVPEFDEKLRLLRQQFARIVLDTPPVLGLSETSSLMRLVDGVVLVIRAERTTHKDLRSAVTALRKAGANFYGFVLNRLDLTRINNYYNYFYYSSYYYEDMAERAALARPRRDRGGHRKRVGV